MGIFNLHQILGALSQKGGRGGDSPTKIFIFSNNTTYFGGQMGGGLPLLELKKIKKIL